MVSEVIQITQTNLVNERVEQRV